MNDDYGEDRFYAGLMILLIVTMIWPALGFVLWVIVGLTQLARWAISEYRFLRSIVALSREARRKQSARSNQSVERRNQE